MSRNLEKKFIAIGAAILSCTFGVYVGYNQWLTPFSEFESPNGQFKVVTLVRVVDSLIPVSPGQGGDKQVMAIRLLNRSGQMVRENINPSFDDKGFFASDIKPEWGAESVRVHHFLNPWPTK